MNAEKLRRRSERALAVLPATHPAASKARRAAAGVGTGTRVPAEVQVPGTRVPAEVLYY